MLLLLIWWIIIRIKEYLAEWPKVGCSCTSQQQRWRRTDGKKWLKFLFITHKRTSYFQWIFRSTFCHRHQYQPKDYYYYYWLEDHYDTRTSIQPILILILIMMLFSAVLIIHHLHDILRYFIGKEPCLVCAHQQKRQKKGRKADGLLDNKLLLLLWAWAEKLA